MTDPEWCRCPSPWKPGPSHKMFDDKASTRILTYETLCLVTAPRQKKRGWRGALQQSEDEALHRKD